jgi:SAM-dependent methyltransferase
MTNFSTSKFRFPIMGDLVVKLLLRPSGGWYTTLTNKIRHRFWGWMYSVISSFDDTDDDFQFINYGYVPDDGVLVQLQDGESTNDRCGHTCLQLYHEVATAVPIKGMNVIEIGCGRGGGTSYVARYLLPKTMTGIDLCQQSINFANTIHKPKCTMNNLHFQVGNATDLVDIPSNAYDVVINVESSHCYANFHTFMMEVYRILKPGGYCVLCDMRVAKHVQSMEQDMIQTGFTIQQNVDITGNVLKSLKVCSATREGLIKEKFGIWFHLFSLFFLSFAGIEGSILYQHFEARFVVYKRYVLQKPE